MRAAKHSDEVTSERRISIAALCAVVVRPINAEAVEENRLRVGAVMRGNDVEEKMGELGSD